MFGSEILDVALGVTFIFLVFSLILTSIQELLEVMLKTRATTLEAGMRQILQDPAGDGLAKAFYDHPLIDALFPGAYRGAKTPSGNLPSYIPAKSFSAVLLALRDANKIVADSPLAGVIAYAEKLAGNSLDGARKELEAWFDGAMERVSGVYKRKTQWRVVAVALLVTLGMNVNTLTIVRSLLQDKALREAVVAQAAAEAQTAPASPTPATAEGVKARFGEIKQLGIPIGWDPALRAEMRAAVSYDKGQSAFPAWLGGFQLILGWLLTIGAISLGAPFWFDTLNKIMVVRATVKPLEKSQPEAPKDPQT
jgi:hypothetical protein